MEYEGVAGNKLKEMKERLLVWTREVFGNVEGRLAMEYNKIE